MLKWEANVTVAMTVKLDIRTSDFEKQLLDLGQDTSVFTA